MDDVGHGGEHLVPVLLLLDGDGLPQLRLVGYQFITLGLLVGIYNFRLQYAPAVGECGGCDCQLYGRDQEESLAYAGNNGFTREPGQVTMAALPCL